MQFRMNRPVKRRLRDVGSGVRMLAQLVRIAPLPVLFLKEEMVVVAPLAQCFFLSFSLAQAFPLALPMPLITAQRNRPLSLADL